MLCVCVGGKGGGGSYFEHALHPHVGVLFAAMWTHSVFTVGVHFVLSMASVPIIDQCDRAHSFYDVSMSTL